jgi:FKBP-type peptidyl-prolyl cis-trans isomerase FkpA
VKRIRAALLIVFAAGSAACVQSTDVDLAGSDAATAKVTADCPSADDSGNIAIAPGLSAKIIRTGYGRKAVDGDYADTNVWLWHYDETAADRHGQFVWESGDRVFQFQIGAGQVIKGWDLGVPCMLEGETRELVVAPELAYGAAGRGASVPPNTTLIFTIELLKLTTPE